MRPSDQNIIEQELRDLHRASVSDAKKLLCCLKRGEEAGDENPHPAMIKPLGGGLFEVRHYASHYGGRAVFCYLGEQGEDEEPILLHVFRKESQKTRPRSLETAKGRMRLIRREK